MKKYIVFLVLGAFLFATSVNAWECEYGTVNAWVKLSNDASWREAMVDGVTLKVHEPFKVKVEITTKTKCYADASLYVPGYIKVFETINGPSKIGYGEDISWHSNYSGLIKTYEWTVRPTGKWTDGWAPLNILIQFTQDPTGYTNKIDKTIIHAYIFPEEWNGSNENNQNEDKSHHTMGFEFVTLSLAIMLYIWRKRNG
ncbi:MAG: sarcinarray family MAST domain-containing protein [Thermoplasmata archaeon]|nr:sarcinarray family MAST domain-containing protein [Thermoplasmata archaeon]